MFEGFFSSCRQTPVRCRAAGSLNVFLRFRSSGMWHWVAGWVVPDVSMDFSAFVFRAHLSKSNYCCHRTQTTKNEDRDENENWTVLRCCHWSSWHVLSLVQLTCTVTGPADMHCPVLCTLNTMLQAPVPSSADSTNKYLCLLLKTEGRLDVGIKFSSWAPRDT